MREQDRALARVLWVEGGELAATSGERWRLSSEGCQELAALVAEVERAVPAGPVTVLIGPGAHRGYGLSPSAPTMVGRTPKAFGGLVAAGWHRPGMPGQPPYVTKTVAMARPGRAGAVRLVPVRWLDVDDFPRWSKVDKGDLPDGLVLARRLEDFGAAVGWDCEGTIPATSLRILRDLVEATAARKPLWHASHERWPRPHQDDGWTRALTGDELAGATHVHGWDAVRCFLSAYGQAVVAADDLRPVHDPQFDGKLAGYWRIVVPELPPTPVEVPAPVSLPPGSDCWVTTAVVALYGELGCWPEILEAWTAPRVEFAGLRHFVEHCKRLLADDAIDPVVRAQVKLLYQTGHGKLRSPGQGIIKRPDWGSAIHDAAWCGLVRKVWQAAGLLPLPARVTRATGLRQTPTPAWPVAISHDEVLYAGGAEAVAPVGIELGDQLGRFRHRRTLTAAEWQDRQQGGRHGR